MMGVGIRRVLVLGVFCLVVKGEERNIGSCASSERQWLRQTSEGRLSDT